MVGMSTAIGRPDLQWGFGDRIRKIRRDIAHKSQAQMADALGVSQKVYAAWESGRSRPADIVAAARRIEAVFGVAASWTLGVDTPVGESPYIPLAA